MSLYHVNYNKNLKPERLEQNENVNLLRERVPSVTFRKIVRILDQQIQACTPSESSQLTFTMLAMLIGYGTKAPACDANYVWEKVWGAARANKRLANYMLGCLAQWRISLDERNWCAVKQETNSLNDFGEEITRTSYWVTNRQ